MDQCPLCTLDDFQERIIFQNESFIVASTRGQITDGGYALVIPRKHVKCLAEINDLDEQDRMADVIQLILLGLSREFQNLSDKISIFEHGIVGQTVSHAHLHILPADLSTITDIIMGDFPGCNFNILRPSLDGEISPAMKLALRYKREQKPYLFWSTGPSNDPKFYVCWNPPAPPQYLRILAAKILNRPERANWRTMDSELDRRLYLETAQRLRLYFQNPA